MILKVQLLADLPLRESLRALFDREDDLVIVSEAADAEGARILGAAARPDVVVIDAELAGGHAYAIAGALRGERPRTRILVLSGHPTQHSVVAALSAGASGFVSKIQPPRELVGAVRVVGNGGSYLCPDLFAVRTSTAAVRALLSERELAVYERLLLGRAHQTIADELEISERNVASLRTRILRKLQLRDANDLLRFAVRHGSAS